jgi:transposase-like protein
MTTRKFKADPKKEFCSNPDCPDCGKRGQGNIVKYGHDRKGKQRFKCTTCGHVYVETKNTIFYNRTLPEEKIILVCKLLVERNGVRAIERITGIHRDTVSSIMQALAEHAVLLSDFKYQKVHNGIQPSCYSFYPPEILCITLAADNHKTCNPPQYINLLSQKVHKKQLHILR